MQEIMYLGDERTKNITCEFNYFRNFAQLHTKYGLQGFRGCSVKLKVQKFNSDSANHFCNG